MHRFWESIIQTAFDTFQPAHIIEIGVSSGAHTTKILAYCQKNNAMLHSIDPHMHPHISTLKECYPDHFTFHENLSLNVLETIATYDMVLIDGDHNWYTVLHELQLIEKQGKRTGMFPVILVHDTEWPYGRRDLYHNPHTIPVTYRQPYKRAGISAGQTALTPRKGIQRSAYHAIYEHSIRNGVYSAIEDFLQESNEQWHYTHVPGLHGLGILAEQSTLEHHKSFASFLQQLTMPDVLGRHIAAIEHDRLNHWMAEESFAMEIFAHKAQREAEHAAVHHQKQKHKDIEHVWRCKEVEWKRQEQDWRRKELQWEQQEHHMLQRELRWKQDLSLWQQRYTHVLHTRSWRCTAPLRHVQRVLQDMVYNMCANLKDLWEDFGEPCPRLVRGIRHGVLGRVAPVRKTPSAEESL